MIAYDFSGESQRLRLSFYNLLAPSGRAHLGLLMQKEKELLSQFVLSYETPEMRRLAAKQKRGQVSPEETILLSKAEKSFKGLLESGALIENKKAIAVVSEYLDCEDIIEEDLDTLIGFAEAVGQQNTEIIMGKQMSYWNLHPDQFSISVFQSIYAYPEYTKQELMKLFNMKLNLDAEKLPDKVFANRDEAELLLNSYLGTKEEKRVLVDKLLSLHVVGEVSPKEYKATLTKLINTLLERDSEFDYEVYQALKDYLPQYHNKKTKYFIFMLAQYNTTISSSVSSRIDTLTLHAFYRKAEELCSY